VNDGKLTARLRNGGRITTDTLDRIQGFMAAHPAQGERPAIIERTREGRAASSAPPVSAPPKSGDPQRNFRFFDNRQKYLLIGNSAHQFEKQIISLESFLADNWKATVSARTGNPIYERPVVLVIYREDHRFLLDPIIPKPGGTQANYDLVIASQPYRARSPLEFKAKRVIAPLARALGPGGRLVAIQSHGHDPGMEIIR